MSTSRKSRIKHFFRENATFHTVTLPSRDNTTELNASFPCANRFLPPVPQPAFWSSYHSSSFQASRLKSVVYPNNQHLGTLLPSEAFDPIPSSPHPGPRCPGFNESGLSAHPPRGLCGPSSSTHVHTLHSNSSSLITALVSRWKPPAQPVFTSSSFSHWKQTDLVPRANSWTNHP